MVYFHTSANVRMLRNIIIDYGASREVSPHEYMQTYIQKCPEATDDAKLSWIAETFLSYTRHGNFVKEIARHLSEELSPDDQDYFTIVFHAVTFQILPKDVHLLYKCLFNLSKPLLYTFTQFLGNNEILTFISQVAQASYDTKFITEKIIGPLFEWQPYISDMGHSYAEYVKRIETRKLKLPTVPMNPTVLNRKGKEPGASSPIQTILPATPPNSTHHKKKKMMTKSVIDQRLKQIHERNKKRAAHLLNDVKTKNFHYAQVKSDKYHKTINSIRDEIEMQFATSKPKQKNVFKSSGPAVKENTAALKRINKRVQLAEEEEVQWLHDVLSTCRNSTRIEELIEFDRQEKERERLLDVEKKHLMGLISYEEALLAKKKLVEENKKKCEEFLKIKESWNEESERLKKFEFEKNRKQIEKLAMTELNILQAKNEIATKKKEKAEKIKQESEEILAKAVKEKQEELERKINMVKEINILAMIAKKARIPKIIDFTETSGFGLLCEMSIAELQERISAMKISLQEELDKKKNQIKEENEAAKQEIEETKSSIKSFMSERALLRKRNKKSNLTMNNSAVPPSKEINDLKRELEEKRKLRMKLTA